VTSFFWSHERTVETKELCRGEELFSVFSELMSEIPPDVILRVFAGWNPRPWLCLLMKGEDSEEGFSLMWFLTGLDKRARGVQVSNAHPITPDQVKPNQKERGW
jgi:hypothetical protein